MKPANESNIKISAPVLVMDSGVGGLSIAAHIRKTCPDTPLFYLADNGAFPYGDKDEGWLVDRVVKLAYQLVNQYPIKLLVLGCNTASTVVLPALRKALSIPVVGVVPAIKPAAALSLSGHIGLLATPGTVNRSYTDQLISDHAARCQVTRVGSTEVVRLAEDKLAGIPVDLTRLKQAVSPLFESETLDTVVLGCTHFPLLRDELEKIQPRNIHWVDSGAAIARRVAMLLSQTPAQCLAGKNAVQSDLLFLTQALSKEASLMKSFRHNGFSQLVILEHETHCSSGF
ncbi:glutamate racemase [Oceanospirillum linum]|nr:glutamate racemase [Oceanospirillum linum]